jgi:hypothetical protein
LVEIVKADHVLGFSFRLAQNGQEQRGKNRNNRDDHQELNQRESGASFSLRSTDPRVLVIVPMTVMHTSSVSVLRQRDAVNE